MCRLTVVPEEISSVCFSHLKYAKGQCWRKHGIIPYDKEMVVLGREEETDPL